MGSKKVGLVYEKPYIQIRGSSICFQKKLRNYLIFSNGDVRIQNNFSQSLQLRTILKSLPLHHNSEVKGWGKLFCILPGEYSSS